MSLKELEFSVYLDKSWDQIKIKGLFSVMSGAEFSSLHVKITSILKIIIIILYKYYYSSTYYICHSIIFAPF